MKKLLLTIEQAWKRETAQGNSCFEYHQYQEAITAYTNAFGFATALVVEIDSSYAIAGIPALEIYNISCFNLANLYWDAGDLEKAEKFFLQPQRSILSIIKNNQSASTATNASIRELKRAVLIYLDFCQKAGIVSKIKADHSLLNYPFIQND